MWMLSGIALAVQLAKKTIERKIFPFELVCSLPE
jgi:hypothetical protein